MFVVTMGILKVMCKRDICTIYLVRSLPRFIAFDIDVINTHISIAQWIRYLHCRVFTHCSQYYFFPLPFQHSRCMKMVTEATMISTQGAKKS